MLKLIVNRHPLIYGALYLLLIPTYALIYTNIPRSFFHATAKYEENLFHEKASILNAFERDFKRYKGELFNRDTIDQNGCVLLINQFKAKNFWIKNDYGFLTCSFAISEPIQKLEKDILFSWNFGDGSTSTQQNPQHVYHKNGMYTVELISCNAQGCCDTVTQNVYINNALLPPKAFNANVLKSDCPLTVDFSPTTRMYEVAIKFYLLWGAEVIDHRDSHFPYMIKMASFYNIDKKQITKIGSFDLSDIGPWFDPKLDKLPSGGTIIHKYFDVNEINNEEDLDISNETQSGSTHNNFVISKDLDDKIINFFYAINGFPFNTGKTNFLRMLYFSAITIATVGYGDIVPITDNARTLVTSEAVLGIIIIGLFLNSLATKIRGKKEEKDQ